MIKISEIEHRKELSRIKFNKKRRRSRSGNSSERTRQESKHKEKIKRKKEAVAKMTEKAAEHGKVTAGGKRVCMWGDCSTVLSIYNYEECCAKHQPAWNLRKSGGFFLD